MAIPCDSCRRKIEYYKRKLLDPHANQEWHHMVPRWDQVENGAEVAAISVLSGFEGEGVGRFVSSV